MSDTFRLGKKSSLLLCLLILLHLAGWLTMKPLWPSSDDLQYALNAVRFHPGSYHPGMNQFENRPGLFIPAALFIRVFGLNPFSISMWPLLLSTLSIALVFVVLQRVLGLWPAFTAGFLVATNTFQLGWALELFPDMPLAFFGILIVCALYFARMETGRVRRNYLLVYAISGVWALLTKESVLLIAPFIGLVFLEDLIKNRHLVFWRNTLIVTIFSILIVLFLYYIWTGDPFHRLRSMYDFSAKHLIDSDGEEYILAGSPHTLLAWLISNLGYIFLLVLSLPAWVIFSKVKNPFLGWILRYSFVIFIELAILFHTPKFGIVFMQARLWMFLVLPLAILAAAVIGEMNRSAIRIISLLLLLLCIYTFVEAGVRRALLFLMFESAAIFCLFFYKRFTWPRYVLLVPFLVLYLSFIFSNSNWGVKMRKRPSEMILPRLHCGSKQAINQGWQDKVNALVDDQMVISSSMCFFNPCPCVTRPKRLFPE
jgi:4-amino-4-deoxy-L-arabinose transferase-like glycosyltransferase